MFDHLWKKRQKIYQPGCRVTVTHLLWEQGQAGSTPVIPTTTVEFELFVQARLLIIRQLPQEFMVQKAMLTYRKNILLCYNRCSLANHIKKQRSHQLCT